MTMCCPISGGGNIGTAAPSPIAGGMGRWLTKAAAPLIPPGTRGALTMQDTGRASGVLTPPEGLPIFENRTHVELVRNEHGIWLIETWLAPK